MATTLDDFSVSLLTPASDLVFSSSTTVPYNALFGRAGNDVLYGFEPDTDYLDTKIDFLFGDLFDNSADEFGIIVDITQGNPLSILDFNIPSVGSDRFVLGDERDVFYTGSDPLALATSNYVGTNEFAVIYDFDATQDVIQLHGDRKDYQLIEVNDLEVEGLDRPFSGEAIFYTAGAVPDLVGYIVSTPEKDYSLSDKGFSFVGDKLPKGSEKKVVQLGSEGIDQGQNTTVDKDGNLYIVGGTGGDFLGENQGQGDAYISKYSNNGNLLWSRQIGSSGGENAYEVVTDAAGDVYLAGDTSGNLFGAKQSTSTDAWVAKLSGSTGNTLWGKQFNAGVLAGDSANPSFANTAFGLDVKGNQVYVSGLAIKETISRQIFDFAVQDDSWVGTFDKDTGAQGWFTQVRDPNPEVTDPQTAAVLGLTPFFDENYDLAVDDAGNSYLVGWTQGLSKESDPSRLLLKYDAYLTKVDKNGVVQWVQQFGSVDEGLEFGWAVDTDSQGNVYASGWTTGDLGDRTNPDSESYDVWLTKFTPDGTQQSTKQIGTNGDDAAFFGDLFVDAADNIYLTGYTNGKLGTGTNGKGKDTNAFVAKFDSQLNEQWIRQLGSQEKVDYATGVSADKNGNVFVTGFTEGSIGGTKDGGSNGSVDSWVARLDSAKGKLTDFTGKDKTFTTDNGGNIAVVDITNSFVTDTRLPNGDTNVSSGLGFVDYGDVVSGLSQFFEPNDSGSFTGALKQAIKNGEVPGLQVPAGTAPGTAPSASVVSADVAPTAPVKFQGTDANDAAKGSNFSDELKGGKGNDTLSGLGGSDKLEGGDGDDFLYGGLGSDEVKGGNGNDILVGIETTNPSLGSNELDKLKGDSGADKFWLGNSSGVFYTGAGNSDHVLIEDFKAAEGDRIQLRGTASQYTLGTNVSGVEKGTAIFYQNDLIGVVKDVSNLDLLNKGVFEYVAPA